MRATTQRPSTRAHAPATARRKGRWIDDWEPEDEAFREARGKRIARKNLALSIFAEHLGFNVWVLWTIVVINLANAGFTLSLSEQFLLIALPNLIGAALRIPYTFAVPRCGGRAWTTATSPPRCRTSRSSTPSATRASRWASTPRAATSASPSPSC